MTLSSKVPAAPAQATVASLPTTCAHTITVASQSTGFTLPGMMLDPGCRSGRWISASPAVGPLASQRRSLQIFVRPTATVRSTPLSSTSESRVAWASKWFLASVNGWPVAFERRSITAFANPGGVLIPVPTAVPPRGTHGPGSTDSSRSTAYLTVAAYPRTPARA